MSIYVIFAIERNIFAIMKKYKYNSSSSETMFTISFTPEQWPLVQDHTPAALSLCYAYMCGETGKAGVGARKGLEQPPDQLLFSSLYS